MLEFTHRLQSSSFLGLPYRILNMNPKKELLWSLWVRPLCYMSLVESLGLPRPECGLIICSVSSGP